MTGRVSLTISAIIGLSLFVGCHAGSWRCRTGSCHLDHAMGGAASCGGCGLASCNSCSGHGAWCSTCGVANCGVHGTGARGPWEHLRLLGRRAVCGDGCGEIYWGEWISDPPDCCDPCDDCGHFTGVRSGCPPKRGLPALRNFLMGYRHGDDCGCTSCVGGESMMIDGMMMEGTYPGGSILEEMPLENQLIPPQPIPDSSVRYSPSPMSSIMQSTSPAPVPSSPASSRNANVRKVTRSTMEQ